MGQGIDSIQCGNGHLTSFIVLGNKVAWTGCFLEVRSGVVKHLNQGEAWGKNCLWCGQDLSEAVNKIEKIVALYEEQK